ncbi:MAG TPA: transposase zinc-binding domain-containing protein, partial [Gammaproteobacteria bacterium]
QQQATQQWCERQLQQVLPVNYFHLVFTLPHDLNGWVQLHPGVLYQCLFNTTGVDPPAVRLGLEHRN